MTNDEQMPELDAAIERLKAATPKTAPWTVWDFSDSGEVPIDKEIAIILNAVVSGELTRADLCASGKRVRAVLEGAVNWLDALLTLVQETSCDPDDPEAFDEVVMAAGMWLSSARAEIERLDRATRRAAAHDASPAVTDKEKEDDDRF